MPGVRDGGYGRGRVNSPCSVSAQDSPLGEPLELQADVVDAVGHDLQAHRLTHRRCPQRGIGRGEDRHDLLVGRMFSARPTLG